MVAGSSVQRAISDAEARSNSVGHVIGRRLIAGQSSGMGASLNGAKIWETESCNSLLEFRDWCDELAKVLPTIGSSRMRIPHLERVRVQRQLSSFPENVIAAVMDYRPSKSESA